MFTKLWNWITGIFKSETIQTLATVGVQLGLMKHPELKEPTIIATQKAIERIDSGQFISPSVLESLLIAEFTKANLSQDKRLIGLAAINLYRPKLEKYLAKIAAISVRTQEIRDLAVLVNNAAGGVAK